MLQQKDYPTGLYMIIAFIIDKGNDSAQYWRNFSHNFILSDHVSEGKLRDLNINDEIFTFHK